MKKIAIYFVVALMAVAAVGCKNKVAKEEKAQMTDSQKLALVKEFSEKALKTVMDGDPSFLNNSVDTLALKELVSRKSSALDIGAGMEIFNGNCRYGDYMLDIVNAGGNFRFDTCYVKDKHYHLVLRTYDEDGSLQFDDLQLNFKNGKVVIEDAFIYSLTANLSDKIASETTLNVFMTIENPTEAAKNMITVSALCQHQDYAQMFQLLNEQKTQLQEFTDYYKFYPIGLYECSKNFVADLEKLRDENVDERFILYHKLCYYIGQADVDATYSTIVELMNYTGDDPIYWVLYAQALTAAKNYRDALIAYNTAKQGMDYIWDIWVGELQCYARLGDKETFDNCLGAGKNLYGMKDEELAELAAKIVR